MFDRDGYMYGTRMYGYNPPSITRVALLGPDFRDVKDSFAIVNDYFEISELHRMTFLRDANGHMTKRLVIGQTLTPSQLNHGPTYTIQELNPAGIRAVYEKWKTTEGAALQANADVIRKNSLRQDVDSMAFGSISDRRCDNWDILTTDERLSPPRMPRDVRKQSVCLVWSVPSHSRRPG